ncbi:hypothetical protein QFC21_000601 [Naganishia friedmannii]|uniref:Uncharacterized protein n=1 Tax=Naganishia friedmannii TaxID=89922 RepID=A0ACC2WDX5_9TREE|nr:hypothetical protein QFC21_000601 [Naganishia friedmannii]
MAAVVGVLLGTRSSRELAITNSFEIALLERGSNGDVDMDTEQSGKGRAYDVDREFLEERREQSTHQAILTAVSPTACKSNRSFLRLIYLAGTPLVRNPEASIAIYISKIFESALGVTEDMAPDERNGKSTGNKCFELQYAVETGEAQRIAVDVVTSLTSQRNDITMLHERMRVLLAYIVGVINGTAQVEHLVLRQISAIVATLPVEYSDVQLTTYLTTLTKSLATLNDLTDRFNAVY